MPVLTGTVTLTHFRVEPPKDFDAKQALSKGLAARAFRPLDRAAQEERAAGWVELNDHDATAFGVGSLFFGERALFTWRVDEFRITAGALRKELDRWKQSFAKEHGRPPGRREKHEAKQEIRHTMKARAEIVTRTTDVCWNLSTQRLDVWTSTRKTIDEVQDAIEHLFGVKLIARAPALVAEDLGLEERALGPTAALATPDSPPAMRGGDDVEREAVEREGDTARADFLRGRAFLGREFLTTLLMRSESTEPVLRIDGAPLAVVFTDRLVLRSIADAVVEAQVRGAMAPYSPAVRRDLARGLLVHQARLRLLLGDRQWSATIDAHGLDVRSVKLPALLTLEDDDALVERLDLVDQLTGALHALLVSFLRMRTSEQWSATVVPELREWMREDAA